MNASNPKSLKIQYPYSFKDKSSRRHQYIHIYICIYYDIYIYITRTLDPINPISLKPLKAEEKLHPKNPKPESPKP